jgi:hypothetical protein
MKIRNTRISLLGLCGVAAFASMVGCQAASTGTMVTVMNETPGALLVDVMRAGSEEMVYDDERVESSGVRQYSAANVGDAAVQIGIRPIEFEAAPAQWIEFPQGGPYLLRVQGTATDLRFVPSLDGAGDLEASDVKPVYTNRKFNEPPVLPSR